MMAEQRDEQTHAIIGAAMRVHTELGSGFLEAVYQNALEVEFQLSNISYLSEVTLEVKYRGRILNCGYRADFICFGEVLVELKAIDRLLGVDEAQVINYLKATGLKRALLFNFGSSRLDYRRIVYDYDR
jgi:GxxExxY protein